ncbi:lipoprotein-releasing ABC transporter permease subunit [Aquisalimonas lutea]|uniref:lipoprotein-releasing ABC transporter permease subunit n=1 Tax=Aquisalimonas lutea TaxID=1327750 RepID=UPI0025B34F80|nr:lipoprotein-releasing ABC transporter permease subunit [Aquisalimonas lutea]MDN3518455.1 lipoprotein-releasing ABC transporter permease subunit [Aquisalimonas lutea]
MFRPLELFIGLRYTRAKRRNQFVSFISLSSILGIALGVTALITVLSVMNGFERDLREKILGMVAHATVEARSGGMDDWRSVVEEARRHPQVQGAAPYVSGQVMITRGGQVSGTMLRGVLPGEEGDVSRVMDHIEGDAAAALQEGEYNIILGWALARELGVRRGDRVTVVTPEARATVAGIVPRLKRFRVVGTFDVGMYEYDRGVALVHMRDAATIMRLGDSVSGVRLQFEELMDAPWLAREVGQSLGAGGYRVSDWTQEHASFFRAVQTEKTVMFVILTLIIAVAAFNIVSTLVMVVNDKRSDIAILRTLGASPATIMGIFMVQGAVIGVVGTVLGVAGGVALALNVETIVPAIESLLGIAFLAPDIYWLSDLPSQLRATDVVHIALVALILSLLATIYPAWRGARTEPAEALRHE